MIIMCIVLQHIDWNRLIIIFIALEHPNQIESNDYNLNYFIPWIPVLSYTYLIIMFVVLDLQGSNRMIIIIIIIIITVIPRLTSDPANEFFG